MLTRLGVDVFHQFDRVDQPLNFAPLTLHEYCHVLAQALSLGADQLDGCEEFRRWLRFGPVKGLAAQGLAPNVILGIPT